MNRPRHQTFRGIEASDGAPHARTQDSSRVEQIQFVKSLVYAPLREIAVSLFVALICAVPPILVVIARLKWPSSEF